MKIDHELTRENIGRNLTLYRRSVREFVVDFGTARGLELIRELKRGRAGSGPYPGVSIFEAANRIMSDLVILHGVKWLLESRALPFELYAVEYGNEDLQAFDLRAEARGKRLVGEAFNVATSYFAAKKSRTLKKLLNRSVRADYRLVMFNHDARAGGFNLTPRGDERYLVVNIDKDCADLLPESRGRRV